MALSTVCPRESWSHADGSSGSPLNFTSWDAVELLSLVDFRQDFYAATAGHSSSGTVPAPLMNYCSGWRQRVETPLIDDSNGVLHTTERRRGKKRRRWSLGIPSAPHPATVPQPRTDLFFVVTADGNEYTSCLLSNLGLSGSLHLSKRPAAPVLCRRNSHSDVLALCKITSG